MTDILVTSPYQPFTLPTQFKAVFNGYIYCGTVDAVDPSVSQVQVYLVNESGDKVPVAQPLRTNAGGFLVYNGQPAKFVTSSNHSLLVRDSLGGQLWYAPNMAEIDPAAGSFLAIEALRRSYAEAGYNLVAGSFETGGTLTSTSDVLLLESAGTAYAWTGAYPVGGYVVAPGIDPTAVTGYVPRTDATLRSDLASESGSELVGYQQVGTGAVVTTVQSKLRETVSVKDFGAVGDGVADDMAAFQRAANYLYDLGGGDLHIPASGAYYLNQYTGADVDNTILWNSISSATISKCWTIPSNVRVIGQGGQANLIINGGTSSPFGYPLSVNVVSFPGEESATSVVFVNQASRTIEVASTSGFSVGQVVCLARRGGLTAGIPNTPSQERAPAQFLTIKALLGGGPYIEFYEDFIHDFAAVSGLLELYRPSEIGAYPENIFFENIRFTKGATSPYILISRTINTGLNNVAFDNARFSFGMSQKIRCGHFSFSTTNNTDALTIESCSDVEIASFEASGNGSTNNLGPLFFADNCRDVHIGKYTANGFRNTGFAALYSFDGHIDELTTVGCGTTATFDGYTGAITVGMPAVGAYGSRAIAESDLYRMRNLGKSRLSINKMRIMGGAQVPVRAHDIELSIDNAYIEFANPGSGLVAPFYIGQSGARRADATYHPNGGQVALRVGEARIKTISGAAAVVSCLNGYSGLFKAGHTTTSALSSAGATTLTVTDPTKLKNGDAIRFVDSTSTGPSSSGATIASMSGSTVTMTAPLVAAVPAGTVVYGIGSIEALAGEYIDMPKVILDDVLTSPVVVDKVLFPEFTTGAGPYTTTVNLTVPGRGDWLLEVANVSADWAHYERREYLVSYDNKNGSFPIAAILERAGPKARTNATVNGATISGSTVTVTLGNSAYGKTGKMFYRWTPTRQIVRI